MSRWSGIQPAGVQQVEACRVVHRWSLSYPQCQPRAAGAVFLVPGAGSYQEGALLPDAVRRGV